MFSCSKMGSIERGRWTYQKGVHNRLMRRQQLSIMLSYLVHMRNLKNAMAMSQNLGNENRLQCIGRIQNSKHLQSHLGFLTLYRLLNWSRCSINSSVVKHVPLTEEKESQENRWNWNWKGFKVRQGRGDITSFIACGICPCTILQRIMCSRSTSLNIDKSPELEVAA